MRRALFLSLVLFASPAFAAAPKVAASVSPIHGLAAAVAEGSGARVDLLIPPGASHHHHQLKPSEAKALSEADLVLLTGAGLEGFLEGPIKTLAPKARVLRLAEAKGARLLEAAHDGHDHGPIDPHLWMDPDNARLWLEALAEAFAAADPDQAALYRANAAAARGDIDTAEREARDLLEPLKDRPYAVYHNAFRYAEARFGLKNIDALTENPEIAPSGADLKRVRARLEETAAVCVFLEPQHPLKSGRALIEGTKARLGRLDSTGAEIPPGPGFYPELVRRFARDMAACLKGEAAAR